MTEQKKNIQRTVLVLVGVMLLILVLFLHKMTTPRFLSQIELKINGLILLNEPIEFSEPLSQSSWWLITSSEKQKQSIQSWLDELPKKIAKNTQVIDHSRFNQPVQFDSMNIPINSVLIINPENQIIAYFKKPLDKYKTQLTYSSVFTHR